MLTASNVWPDTDGMRALSPVDAIALSLLVASDRDVVWCIALAEVLSLSDAERLAQHAILNAVDDEEEVNDRAARIVCCRVNFPLSPQWSPSEMSAMALRGVDSYLMLPRILPVPHVVQMMKLARQFQDRRSLTFWATRGLLVCNLRSSAELDLFLGQGADVGVVHPDDGPILVRLAQVRNNTGIEALLGKWHAAVDAVDKDGNTALHWAAAKGSLSCVNALLARGANAQQRNKREKTPLFRALLSRDPTVVAALLLRLTKQEAALQKAELIREAQRVPGNEVLPLLIAL